MHLWPSIRLRDSFKQSNLFIAERNLQRMKLSKAKSKEAAAAAASDPPSSTTTDPFLLPSASRKQGGDDNEDGAAAPWKLTGALIGLAEHLLLVLSCCLCCGELMPTVQVVCTEGPDRVKELIAIGASFDKRDDGQLHLAREGGHSHRRIVHAADMTGREIERALLKAIYDDPNIFMFGHHFAIDLLTSQEIINPKRARGKPKRQIVVDF